MTLPILRGLSQDIQGARRKKYARIVRHWLYAKRLTRRIAPRDIESLIRRLAK